MLTVDEAIARVKEHIEPLKGCKIEVSDTASLVLASNIYAPIDIPAFLQSSMDGYALKFDTRFNILEVTGEMAAGAGESTKISGNTCSRIFTGAPLPEGADTVVMQEKVLRTGNVINVKDENLLYGANVRAIGAEIHKDALAMEKGAFLSPAAIGFLSGIGISEIEAIPQPTVTIIITGKELSKPGNKLEFGQVYESNSYALRAALQLQRVPNVRIEMADDDLDILSQVLDKSLNCSDMVLLTGGVSVGDYDFVIEATKRCNVQQVFYKVRQKPGKPLYFGLYHGKPVFGLPGNPASVLSCYYNYVYPAINLLRGNTTKSTYANAKLTQQYNKPAGLTHFLKGFYSDGLVTPLQAQESFKLSSFALANCLIRLDEDQAEYSIGDNVQIIHLI